MIIDQRWNINCTDHNGRKRMNVMTVRERSINLMITEKEKDWKFFTQIDDYFDDQQILIEFEIEKTKISSKNGNGFRLIVDVDQWN